VRPSVFVLCGMENAGPLFVLQGAGALVTSCKVQRFLSHMTDAVALLPDKMLDFFYAVQSAL
jgi:hypothetical protein